MAPIQKKLELLAKQLNLTSYEDEIEEYILTKEEEENLVRKEIDSQQKHLAWKMRQYLSTAEEIYLKISQIDWDEKIDKQLLFQRANSSKQYGIWEKQQREKEKEELAKKQKELKEQWTAKRMYHHMAWVSENQYGKKLIVKDDKRGLDFTKFITALCFFVSRDERFETELGYSLNKGLLIRGISGLGKTHLVKCLEHNSLNPILILSMLNIADEIKDNGEYLISYGHNKIIYLDDVGTEEPTINHYGTKINFFKNFIEGVYLRTQTFNHIMFSTNNSASELQEKYGFRVRSRMKDMFNVIDVSGKDIRGNG